MLDTYDLDEHREQPELPAARASVFRLWEPSLGTDAAGGPVDFRHVSLDPDHIDPDLKPMKQGQEVTGRGSSIS